MIAAILRWQGSLNTGIFTSATSEVSQAADPKPCGIVNVFHKMLAP